MKSRLPITQKKSGVLIDGRLLLDCGDERFLAYDPKYILITHLHPDHAFFVEDEYEIDIPLYAPEKCEGIDIKITKSPFTINGYRIVPIPTVHSVLVKSNAYLITHKRKTILYTGDMIWIEKKYHKLFKHIDLVIADASFIRTGGLVRRKKETGQIYGHTGVPNIIRMFKKYTSKILFIHFGAWFYKDIRKARKKFKALAHENDIEIIVGYDGLELTI